MSWSNVAVDPLDAVLGAPSCSNQVAPHGTSREHLRSFFSLLLY